MAAPVRFTVVRNKLQGAGFKLVRISGSHHIFDRPGGPLISIPVHSNLVKPFYARQVEKIIADDKARKRGDPKSGEEPPGE